MQICQISRVISDQPKFHETLTALTSRAPSGGTDVTTGSNHSNRESERKMVTQKVGGHVFFIMDPKQVQYGKVL